MTTNEATGTEEFLPATPPLRSPTSPPSPWTRFCAGPALHRRSKIGRRVLIPRATFVAWINSQTVEGVR